MNSDIPYFSETGRLAEPGPQHRAARPSLARWLPWFVACLAASLVLSNRQIGVAWDDRNYVLYFNPSSSAFSNIISNQLEEPGWGFLIHIMTAFQDPITSLRVIIFSASLLFPLSVNKIVNDRWMACNAKSWFILAAFILIPSISAGVYFAAIRQGVAESAFLFSVALGAAPLLSALIGSSVHSATVVFGSIDVASKYISMRTALIAAIVVGIYSIGLAVHAFESPLAGFNLGRRTFAYLNASSLNFYGNAIEFITYVPPLILMWRHPNRWTKDCLLLLPVAVGLSAINPGFQRLFAMLDVFMLIGLALALDRRAAQIAAAYFLCAVVGVGVFESRHGDPRGTYVGQWSLILASR